MTVPSLPVPILRRPGALLQHLAPLAFACAVLAATLAATAPLPAAPVLFVTQTPTSDDFTNVVAVFGNHRGGASFAPRGGDLLVRYDDGSVRNLTAELGFGATSTTAIAVRDPHVHWDGTKALFSMVIGGTTQDNYTPVYFQIYEVANFGQAQTPTITLLPQPSDFNNITPIYGTDDRIIFTSDRPRNGDRILYPQLDEYESAPTVSGIWSMAPDGSDLILLDHAPSGDFRPMIDSAGRLIFSRWDHLQRDQQADSDIGDLLDGQEPGYGTITFESEQTNEYHLLTPGDEVFPEARTEYGDPAWDFDHHPTEEDHRFNQFVPWQMNEDGTDLEVLNHLGRHEFFTYIQRGRSYLSDFFAARLNLTSFLTPIEDPTRPGYFYGIDAPEFATHAAGQIIALNAPYTTNPDDIDVEHITHIETRSYYGEGQTPGPDHIGMFRDPMVTADGTLWAAHSTSAFADRPTITNPPAPAPFVLSSRYDFAIKRLVAGSGAFLVPGERLVASPIMETISYWENQRYRPIQYSGPLWELQPVEAVARPRPPRRTTPITDLERAILLEELGGEQGLVMLQDYLRAQELALVVSRDVTRRADRQQDYNLKIAWSDHETTSPGVTPKEIAWLQFMEGRQVRGLFETPSRGRRVLARPMAGSYNPPVGGAPEGAVRLGDDGSAAAFVPARRALSWQTNEMDGTPAVRERYWLTFQPGEIRTCVNCHGVNTTDVMGNPPPTNEPEALRDLLRWWKSNQTAPPGLIMR